MRINSAEGLQQFFRNELQFVNTTVTQTLFGFTVNVGTLKDGYSGETNYTINTYSLGTIDFNYSLLTGLFHQRIGSYMSHGGYCLSKDFLKKTFKDYSDIPFGKKETKLFELIEQGDIPGVKNAIKEGALPFAICTSADFDKKAKSNKEPFAEYAWATYIGYQAIHFAAAKANAAMMSFLCKLPEIKNISSEGLNVLSDKMNTSSNDVAECAPLHIATWRGKLDNVIILLDEGADINVTNSWGGTPLHEAAKFDRIDIYDELKKRGAKTDIKDKFGHDAQYYLSNDNDDCKEFKECKTN